MKNLKLYVLTLAIAWFYSCNKVDVGYKERALVSAWKEAGLDTNKILPLIKEHFDNTSINEIKTNFHSEMLFNNCLDGLPENISDNERRSSIMDYLISYANVKMIEEKLFSNEIVANNIKVSPLPYYSTSNKMDTVIVTIGLNYPEGSKNNPFLILDSQEDTIFYDAYYDNFLVIPSKNASDVSGLVYVYHSLHKRWFPMPFKIPLRF